MALEVLAMSLQHLADALRTAEAVQEALGSNTSERLIELVDLPAAARSVVKSIVADAHSGPVLVLTSRPDQALDLAVQLREFATEPASVELWPSPDALPFEQLPWDPIVSARRVTLLNRLINQSTSPLQIVTAVPGLTHQIMPASEFLDRREVIRTGDRVDFDAIVLWAIESGYRHLPLVTEPGTIARRGGIIDIYPPQAEHPTRLDFFGDTVDSIREFDAGNQRSVRSVDEITLISPAEVGVWRMPLAAAALSALNDQTLRPEVRQEWRRMIERMRLGHTPDSLDLYAPWLHERPETLIDYLPANTLIIADDMASIELVARHREKLASELESAFVNNGELPAEMRAPVAAWSKSWDKLATYRTFTFGNTTRLADRTFSLATVEDAPLFAGRLARVSEYLEELLKAGWRVVVATGQADRVTELLEEHGVYPRRHAASTFIHSTLMPGEIDVVRSELAAGWQSSASKLLLLTDLELFGFRRQPSRMGQRRQEIDPEALITLPIGEHVVHVDHGIAIFQGLVRREQAGVEREYLLLEYARGDKLFVPVEQSHRIARYSGGGADARVTTLGSGEWLRTQRRVRRSVREMAFELVQLYATREAAQGHAFPADSGWDAELAESFPYTETTDQRRAIEDVTRDLESKLPMDRLVCGDVGFGKTEVALRASFKVVIAGRQVAILVPTTVLALQHFSTFTNRLAAFPLRVEMLSRLRSAAEQRKVLEDLRIGAVDIVIGTHRLVQRDVAFKDLGLLIIDEEQRFGVRQKEFLRTMRAEVDTLTMSATPIPRTLHMSLAGIRDISIIDTPPQERMPVRTFVTEASDHLIREVVLREIERGGQVYVVHNRVHSIGRYAQRLRELLPGVRISVGHGQMDEHELEDVMLSFVRHESDLLLCTTIIESGVDIPNVNTIIIDNAERFGLTQLHQLRGRVGRSTSRAYAYLLHRKDAALSIEALERLEAIQEASELGAGMRVALRDMEIRGAGNLLGAEQSGHIADIGYDLYIRLLSQAVEEIRKGRPFAEIAPVLLDLPITALLPADYVPDVELRLATYRRISGVDSLTGVAAISRELADRFGPPPVEVERLLAIVAIRIRAEELGLESIIEREREIVIRPVKTSLLDRARLESSLGSALRLTPNSVRIRLVDLKIEWQSALELTLREIESLDVESVELTVSR